MFTDFKFNFVKRDGLTTKLKVSFYEGNIELDDGGLHNISRMRYRRISKLKTVDFEFAGDKSGNELKAELEKELVKDLNRTPINEQKI